MRASMTEYGIDHLPDAPREVLFQVRDHLKSGAPRIKDLQEQIKDRVWHGFIAGQLILRSSVGVDLFGEKSLTKQYEEIAALLKRDFQIEPRTMSNPEGPVRKFRPVAHLWAAYAVQANQGQIAFPCTVAGLPNLLGAAEAIRIKAEATKLPRSPSTVMRPGEAVRLPPEVSRLLPKVEFTLATLPETRH